MKLKREPTTQRRFRLVSYPAYLLERMDRPLPVPIVIDSWAGLGVIIDTSIEARVTDPNQLGPDEDCVE